MGSVGPDDDEPSIAFIPKQSNPEEDFKAQVKATTEAGLRRMRSALDLMEDDEKLKFVIQDLLPDSGLMYIGGASGTGKTILAIQLAVDIVLGRPTMTWRLGDAWHENFKALVLSLEMNSKELQLRLNHMYPNLTDEERKAFDTRVLTYSEPEGFQLWNPVHIVDLIRMVKAERPDLILIDSASVSFGDELTNQKQVNETLKNLYMVRARMNLSMIVVAHTRKPSIEMINSPENASLHELFGHSGVAQSASSIILMLEDEDQRKMVAKKAKGGDQNIAQETEKVVHIVNAKARFGANSGAFKAHLTSKKHVENGQPLMFKRNAIPIEMTEEQRKNVKKTPAVGLKDLMSEINFGSVLDGDE
jgi:hypothetical protein